METLHFPESQNLPRHTDNLSFVLKRNWTFRRRVEEEEEEGVRREWTLRREVEVEGLTAEGRRAPAAQ